MKKRIFIAIHYLEIGGAEISLIGLLNAIDTEQYDVDLFLYSHRGELLKQVLKTVDIRSPKTVISVHFSYSYLWRCKFIDFRL